MDTHVPVEVDRHVLEQYRLTGFKADKHYQLQYIGFPAGASLNRPKVQNLWIHERILSILLFRAPLIVHIPCKNCGAATPVKAFPEELAAMDKMGHLCKYCYAKQEEAREYIDA